MEFTKRLLLAAAVLAAIWSVAPAAVLSPGDLIVADDAGTGVGRIVRVDPTTGAQTLISSGGNLDIPWGIAVDRYGSIFVADGPGVTRHAPEIIRINPMDGSQQVISAGGLLASPMNVVVDAQGAIIVSDRLTSGRGGILKIDPATGAQTLISSGGYFNGVSGLALDQAGFFYVDTTPSGGQGLAVLKIDPSTGAQTLVSSDASNRWYSGIAVGATGKIYATEIYYNNGIIEVDPVTGIQTFISQYGYMQDPWGLDIDDAGAIIVADGNWAWPGEVIKVDPMTGTQTLLSYGGLLVDPTDVVVYKGAAPEPGTIVIWSLLGTLAITIGWWHRRKAV